MALKIKIGEIGGNGNGSQNTGQIGAPISGTGLFGNAQTGQAQNPQQNQLSFGAQNPAPGITKSKTVKNLDFLDTDNAQKNDSAQAQQTGNEQKPQQKSAQNANQTGAASLLGQIGQMGTNLPAPDNKSSIFGAQTQTGAGPSLKLTSGHGEITYLKTSNPQLQNSGLIGGQNQAGTQPKTANSLPNGSLLSQPQPQNALGNPTQIQNPNQALQQQTQVKDNEILIQSLEQILGGWQEKLQGQLGDFHKYTKEIRVNQIQQAKNRKTYNTLCNEIFEQRLKKDFSRVKKDLQHINKIQENSEQQLEILDRELSVMCQQLLNARLKQGHSQEQNNALTFTSVSQIQKINLESNQLDSHVKQVVESVNSKNDAHNGDILKGVSSALDNYFNVLSHIEDQTVNLNQKLNAYEEKINMNN